MKTRTITVRLNDREYARFEKQAAARGMSMAKCIMRYANLGFTEEVIDNNSDTEPTPEMLEALKDYIWRDNG